MSSNWRLAVAYLSHRFMKVVLISLSEFLNSVFTVKSLSDNFIGLHELVNLSSEFIVLMSDNTDVVVHGVNFNLQVCIVLKES